MYVPSLSGILNNLALKKKLEKLCQGVPVARALNVWLAANDRLMCRSNSATHYYDIQRYIQRHLSHSALGNFCEGKSTESWRALGSLIGSRYTPLKKLKVHPLVKKAQNNINSLPLEIFFFSPFPTMGSKDRWCRQKKKEGKITTRLGS